MQIKVSDFSPGINANIQFDGEAALFLHWLVFRDLAIRDALLAVSDPFHANKCKDLIDALRLELERFRMATSGITDPTLFPGNSGA